MNLFPIGTVDSTSSQGTIDSISNLFFEPNDGVTGGAPKFNMNVIKVKDQFINTYKTGVASKQFGYKYKNIFDREYRILDSFVTFVEGSLTSFFAVDLSTSDYLLGTITDSTSISTNISRYFSSTLHTKANHAFIWNGIDFMIGTINDLNTTSITISHTYGKSSIPNSPMLYPIYEVYLTTDFSSAFTPDVYYKTVGVDRGWIRSGALAFITKYGVE